MKKASIAFLLLFQTFFSQGQFIPSVGSMNLGQGSNGSYSNQPRTSTKSGKRDVIYAPKEKSNVDSIRSNRFTNSQNYTQLIQEVNTIRELFKNRWV